MSDYERLLEIVESKMQCYRSRYGSIKGAKIHNKEEFDLMISFWSAGHSSCYYREKVHGVFEGEDWYFEESETTDYGMEGKSTVYWTETLTAKKKKFSEFCKKFDCAVGDVSDFDKK